MKLKIKLFIPIIIMILLSGCGAKTNNSYTKLPDTPIIFHSDTFINPDDDTDTYTYITYNDRKYVFYGTLGKKIHMNDSEFECIGYVYREDFPDDTNEHIYRLSSTDDYLMNYYVAGEMVQPDFFRAIDTASQDIYTPEYIDSLGYEFWN